MIVFNWSDFMNFGLTNANGILNMLRKREETALSYTLSIETERLYLKLIGNPYMTSFYYEAILKETNQVVESVSIVDENDIWFQTLEQFRNNGYITEATKKVLEFCPCDMNFYTNINNKASIRVMKKLNLKFCGIQGNTVNYLYRSKKERYTPKV